MCGINGFNFENKKLINLMNKKIKHRGPDDEGIFTSKSISLGQVRLSILDLTKKGHQPMGYNVKKNKIIYNDNSLNKADLIISYNGEIYNFKELKKKLILEGYKFETNTDTEVILKLYNKYGIDCFEKFNGMWALAIYDKKKKELILSRDRFGQKPLYYYFNKKTKKLIFSSELKSILIHNIKKEISKKSLEEIFTYRFTFGENTILKNIYLMTPGTIKIFDLKKKEFIMNKKFYEINIKKSKISFKDAKNKIKNLIEDSVKKRMIADVEVGSFLSGGIDSSLITFFAKKYNKKLKTYSIGFDKTNELDYAKKVSDTLKTGHKTFTINKDNVLNYIDEMVYHMDEPIGADPGFLPIYLLSKEASKYNKVVLSGDAADEIFTGYDRYKLFLYGEKVKKFVPNFIKKSDNQILKRLYLMKNKNSLDSFFEITRVFEDDELEKMNLKTQKPNFKYYENLKTNELNKIQIFDIKNLLSKDFFMKSDKMSSSFGLEQRTPFIDYRIAEIGLSLPLRYRIFGLNEKYILKKIARDVGLPKESWKRKKHGFNVPIDYWFENKLGEKLKELLQNNKHNLYNKKYIFDLLNELKDNKSSFKSRNIIAQKLWTVLIFEIWYNIFIKNEK